MTLAGETPGGRPRPLRGPALDERAPRASITAPSPARAYLASPRSLRRAEAVGDEEDDADDPPAVLPRSLRMNARSATMAAAILGSGIVFLDSTVVNVALPRIGTELHSSLFAPLEGESYVYNGYLLTLSALLILAGALADAYGRRRLFVLGLAGFGVASVLCGLAPSLETLVLFRVAQGAAGALLVPGALALLTANLQGEERGRAFGLWAAASSGTAILGPVVGGLLVETVSWRAVFLINIPLVVAGIWIAARYVPESRDEDAGRQFDWAGALVAAIAIGGLSFGAIYGQEHDWQGIVAPLAIGAGAVACVLFVALMARGRHPLVPLGLFRSRNFAVVNLTTLLIYGALYVAGYTQTLFAQGTLGYSAAGAGFIGIAGSLFMIVLSPRIGRLSASIGPRRFMAAGPVLMAAGLLWLARIPADSTPWKLAPGDGATLVPPLSYVTDFLIANAVFGIGLAILVSPLTTALMSSVPEHRAGLGSAINNAISRVGPQLAGAAVFVVVTAAFYADLAGRVGGVDTTAASFRHAVAPLNPPGSGVASAVAAAARVASTDSFHVAMLVAAGLLLAGAVINWVGISDEQATHGTAGQAASVDGPAGAGSDAGADADEERVAAAG